MIVRIVKMTFEPDRVDDFLEIFGTTKDQIRDLKGCAHLELLEDKENPNVFFTLSQWEEEEHLEKYRESYLFENIWEKTKPLFAKKAEAWTCKSKIKLL